MPEDKAITQPSLHDLIEACDKERPKPGQVKALQQYLREHPEVMDKRGDLATQNINRITSKPGWTAAAKEMTRADITNKRAKLGYTEAPQLEKMLIDVVLLAWLQLQEWQIHYIAMNQGEGMTLTKAAFWEKRLSAAEGRYLRAVETLARVRKLARQDPALQVNITQEGGQSVNVAGDLVREAK